MAAPLTSAGGDAPWPRSLLGSASRTSREAAMAAPRTASVSGGPSRGVNTSSLRCGSAQVKLPTT